MDKVSHHLGTRNMPHPHPLLSRSSTLVDFKFHRNAGAAPAGSCQVTKLYTSGNLLPHPLCLGSATLLMGPRLPHPSWPENLHDAPAPPRLLPSRLGAVR